ARADRDDLLHRGLEAEPPQLAHIVLERVARVVGEERDPLARLTQRRDCRGRVLDDLLADPQAAVEVEQDGVVLAQGGGERHRGHYAGPPMRLMALLTLCALALAACGSAKEKPASKPAPATTAAATAAPTQGVCQKVAAPQPKGAQHNAAPTLKLDPRK